MGSSKKIHARWWHHANLLGHGTHHAQKLQALWTADGPEAFHFVVLEQCAIEDLVLREQAWLDSFEEPLNGSLNAACSTLDPEVAERAAASRRGRKHSPERCQRISAALKGVPLTAERRQNISAARKGKTLSPAHVERLRESMQTDSRRNRLRNIMATPEGRQKQIDAHWSRTPQAAEIVARTNATKAVNKTLKEGE